MKKILTLTFLILILCSNAASAAAKGPFVVHKGPFGPDIKGLQLGQKFKDFGEMYALMAPFDDIGIWVRLFVVSDGQEVGSLRWIMDKSRDAFMQADNLRDFYFYKDPSSGFGLFTSGASRESLIQRKKLAALA
ncbi:MAG: hypothetical protein LBG29_04220 [Synergistaceae bacterium]|jgi:hypothetical protein|nr:hypothetical protein [Synergistaceae bacterium]